FPYTSRFRSRMAQVVDNGEAALRGLDHDAVEPALEAVGGAHAHGHRRSQHADEVELRVPGAGTQAELEQPAKAFAAVHRQQAQGVAVVGSQEHLRGARSRLRPVHASTRRATATQPCTGLPASLRSTAGSIAASAKPAAASADATW